MDLKLTRERMGRFWEYGKVYLVLAIAAAIALFYTAYALTEPKVPAAERFDILQGGTFHQAGVEVWKKQLLDGVTVGQRQINIEALGLGDYSADNALMVIGSRMVAQDGDIFILPYTVYSALAKSENLVDLEAPIPGDPEGRSVLDRLTLPPEISYDECRITVTRDETLTEDISAAEQEAEPVRKICGLNMTHVDGLLEIGVIPSDYVLCIPDYRSVDYENVIRVIQWILDEKMVYTDPETVG